MLLARLVSLRYGWPAEDRPYAAVEQGPRISWMNRLVSALLGRKK